MALPLLRLKDSQRRRDPTLHQIAPTSDALRVAEWLAADRTLLASRCCLFLDLDGTLIEFHDDPAAIGADEELRQLLQSTSDALGGALAVISGRSIAALDVMLAPLRLAASGIYGQERRDSRGVIHRKSVETGALDPIRAVLTDFLSGCPGVLVEDKGTALALHFRAAPAYGPDCRKLLHMAAAELGPGFQVVDGSMIVEIAPAGTSKATGIEDFLLEPPFATRVPIALGDDWPDVDAFSAVHRHGGLALVVGTRIEGDFHLDNCRAARDWLAALACAAGQ
jgi:trehalose 6-phosphate phosphatase